MFVYKYFIFNVLILIYNIIIYIKIIVIMVTIIKLSNFNPLKILRASLELSLPEFWLPSSM